MKDSAMINQTSSTRTFIDTTESHYATQSNRNLKILEVVGNGTFGVVYKAELNGALVAVKKVFLDKRYKNREKEIICSLNNPNIIRCLDDFESQGEKKNEVYLNLVMEFMSLPLSSVIRDSRKRGTMISLEDLRLYSYQMFKGLAYLESLKICHRDIKPQNILVNHSANDKRLKICDFGSAKQLREGEQNISYICSRYYRAPELIFKAEHYTTSIDVWSIGCVIGEMVLGEPLFAGENSLDQLVEIIRILGTPTKKQIEMMNPSHSEFRFPQIKSYTWTKVFEKASLRVSEEDREQFKLLLDLIARVLVFAPQERPTSIQALAHPFFDDLRRKENFGKYQYLKLFEFSESKQPEKYLYCSFVRPPFLFEEEKSVFYKELHQLNIIPYAYQP